MGVRSPKGGLRKLLSATIASQSSLTVDDSFPTMRLQNEFVHLRRNCLTLAISLAGHLKEQNDADANKPGAER
jgi:hypothetical protein